MTTSEDTSTPEAKPSVEQLQSDIEQTREQLGETVDALTAKLDVKSRTKARVGETKERAATRLRDAQSRASALGAKAQDQATDETGKPKPAVLAGVAGLVAVVVAVSVLARQRRR